MATMTCTEPIRVGSYVTAASLALKIASPLFQRAMQSTETTDPRDESYQAWKIIRSAAEHFMRSRSVKLSIGEFSVFSQACRHAHELEHECQPGPEPSIDHCACVTADRIKSIFDLFERDERKEAPDAA